MSVKTGILGSRLFSVFVFFILVTSAVGITPVHAAGIRYAKPAATGTGDCLSWANACTLQTALTGAASGNEVWATAGTYKPTTVVTDRTATFQLNSGVSLYGGFAGTETTRDQLIFYPSSTILSGDIDNNDSQTPIITNLASVIGNSTNSYHVVSSASGATTLVGFTITAGYANSTGNAAEGGGMFNNSNISLTNVTFRGNMATGFGGGLSSEFGSPTLTNVSFWGNKAANAGAGGIGGGMFNHFGSPTLTNVTFKYNSSTGTGGGWHNNYGVNPTLMNASFFGNTASDGSAMSNNSSSPTLTNVTISGNQTPNTNGGHAMVNLGSSSPQIWNTIFWDNTDHLGNAIQINSGSAVNDSVVQGGCPAGSTCTNVTSADPLLDSPSNGFGNFNNQSFIPLLAGSSAIDTGSDAVCPPTDQRGVPRPKGAQCDIGAYERDTVPPTVSSVVRAGTNPTGATSVNFTVTFSESVFGVDATDFNLNTSGVSGESIGTVTGSGTTWTVPINTGIGDGTIRLDVNLTPGIWDWAGNQLSNGITSGDTYTIIRASLIYLPLVLRNQP